MSRDDPSYVPSSTNPFASIQRFQHGRKLLGTSIDYAAELPSPGNSFFPLSPGNLGQRGGRDGIGTVCVCDLVPKGVHENRTKGIESKVDDTLKLVVFLECAQC